MSDFEIMLASKNGDPDNVLEGEKALACIFYDLEERVSSMPCFDFYLKGVENGEVKWIMDSGTTYVGKDEMKEYYIEVLKSLIDFDNVEEGWNDMFYLGKEVSDPEFFWVTSPFEDEEPLALITLGGNLVTDPELLDIANELEYKYFGPKVD